MRPTVLASTALLLLVAGLAAAQPTILDGGFEADLGAWTYSGAAFRDGGSPRTGSFCASWNGVGFISQPITGLTSGASYTITFFAQTGTIGTYSGLTVTVDSGTPTVVLPAGTTQSTYQMYTVNFVATSTKATLQIAASYSIGGKKRAAGDGYHVDDVSVGVCSLCGDPHIVGLDNSRYDFMGEPGMVFALLSEPSVQLNSRFVAHGKGTAIGPLCIRTCQHTLEIHPNHTVIVDGKLRAPGTKSVAGKSEHVGKDLVMTRYNARMTWLSFGAWSMLLQHGKHNFNIINLKHHADHDTEELHGVYGMSAIPNHHQHDKKHCQPWKNGGCELIGKWQDYALADQTSLCGAEWTYTKFDPKKC